MIGPASQPANEYSLLHVPGSAMLLHISLLLLSRLQILQCQLICRTEQDNRGPWVVDIDSFLDFY